MTMQSLKDLLYSIQKKASIKGLLNKWSKDVYYLTWWAAKELNNYARTNPPQAFNNCMKFGLIG